MKELVIGAAIENLDAVLDFVNEGLEETGCDMKMQSQINIVVEEIFVNIAKYAYNPDIGGAVIRMSIGEGLVIEFEDQGTPYNPLEKSDPDITKAAEEREIGGLGIYMVKQMMDSMEYRHVDNKNILTIKKLIIPA